MNEEAPKAFLDADHIPQTLDRLDALIGKTESIEKVRAGLGMRLALSMALEIKEGKAPGTDTSDLVEEWVERHGQDTVDAAVGIARGFLTRPGELAKELAQRLGLNPGGLNN
jgi:hypothetical protein